MLGKKKTSSDYTMILWGVLFLFLVVVLWWLNGHIFIAYVDAQNRGIYGDMFGAVNALFSGLAFTGIIITILLQRQELSLQREELSHTRAEIKGQKEQMELQNQTLKKQQFENTFFSLLKLLNEQTETLNISHGDSAYRGKACFSILYSLLKKRYWKIKSEGRSADKLVTDSYEVFYNNYHNQLGHYFRTLYNVIKFVDNSNLEDRRFYTNLVRAQLSSSELCLIFYNGVNRYGVEKFKPLIQKYTLLKALPIDQLLEKDHLELYQNEAFNKKDLN